MTFCLGTLRLKTKLNVNSVSSWYGLVILKLLYMYSWAQVVKNQPAVQETQAWSLGQEDFLEEGMATHFNIFAWRIPRTEEPGGLQSVGSQRVGHEWPSDEHFHFHTWAEQISKFIVGTSFLLWEIEGMSKVFLLPLEVFCNLLFSN